MTMWPGHWYSTQDVNKGSLSSLWSQSLIKCESHPASGPQSGSVWGWGVFLLLAVTDLLSSHTPVTHFGPTIMADSFKTISYRSATIAFALCYILIAFKFLFSFLSEFSTLSFPSPLSLNDLPPSPGFKVFRLWKEQVFLDSLTSEFQSIANSWQLESGLNLLYEQEHLRRMCSDKVWEMYKVLKKNAAPSFDSGTDSTQGSGPTWRKWS